MPAAAAAAADSVNCAVPPERCVAFVPVCMAAS